MTPEPVEHYLTSLGRLRGAVHRDDLPLPNLADPVPDGNTKATAIIDAVMARLTEDALAARNVFMSCTFLHPISVKNAALVWNHECGHCNELVDSPVCDVDHALVSTELGWCACGSTDRVDELAYRYLAWVAIPMEDRPRRDEQLTADVGLLLAYICDDLGWTEHGTSINGEWLTDDGHTALANLRTALGHG